MLKIEEAIERAAEEDKLEEMEDILIKDEE